MPTKASPPSSNAARRATVAAEVPGTMAQDVSGDRRPMHERQVTCRAYARTDGLYEIEATLTDVKAYPVFVGDRDRIEPGEPFHEMYLRLVIDADLDIREVVARTARAPYGICGDIASRYARLVGLNLGAGFMKQARAIVGGTSGCTHLTELLGPAATTAIQAVWHVRDRLDEPVSERAPKLAPATQCPPELDHCHALRRDGDVVRRYHPDFHLPVAAASDP